MFRAYRQEVNLNAFSSGRVVTLSTTLLLNIPSWLASSYGLFACSVMYSVTHIFQEQVSRLGEVFHYVSVITNWLLRDTSQLWRLQATFSSLGQGSIVGQFMLDMRWTKRHSWLPSPPRVLRFSSVSSVTPQPEEWTKNPLYTWVFYHT